MRLAFMGTPDFAVPALRALHDAGHSIVAVYCQPPRPSGRGQTVRKSPVHEAAEALGLPVLTPSRLRTDTDAQAAFRALDLDAAIVAAYGLILPQAMLDAPRRGCLNIHASLLPRWRGAAPIQAAIRAGDAETGVTIMQMDAGLDTGAMLSRQSWPITVQTTAATLHDDLAVLGARMIVQVLATQLTPVPQDNTLATYAAKLTKDDARIDWHKPAADLDRQIRAFDPWPGTFTTWRGTILKVLAAMPVTGNGVPGTVLDAHLTIAAGTQALRITKLQMAGRSALPAADFLRGSPIPAGAILGT